MQIIEVYAVGEGTQFLNIVRISSNDRPCSRMATTRPHSSTRGKRPRKLATFITSDVRERDACIVRSEMLLISCVLEEDGVASLNSNSPCVEFVAALGNK